MAIRSAAKALVIKNGKILVNRCAGENGEYYFALPGGGQHQYEALEDTVIREVLEETGFKVKIIRFAALCEEIQENERLRRKAPDYSHAVLHIFLATSENESPFEITEKDDGQIDSLWLSLEEADELNFKPRNITGRISEMIKSEAPLYFGAVHIN